MAAGGPGKPGRTRCRGPRKYAIRLCTQGRLSEVSSKKATLSKKTNG